MDKIIVTFCFLIQFYNPTYCSLVTDSFNPRSDTTIVAKILDCDSIFTPINSSRAGIRFYYGVHHFKIGIFNIESKTITDTIVIAQVYNMNSDHALYLKNFNFKKGGVYVFDLSEFTPCHTDFPRLQGRCNEDGAFLPVSDKLIREYKRMFRIVNQYKSDLNSKKGKK